MSWRRSCFWGQNYLLSPSFHGWPDLLQGTNRLALKKYMGWVGVGIQCFSLLVWIVIESVISGEGNWRLTESCTHCTLSASLCFLTLFSDRITLCLAFLPYWAARPWWRHTLLKDCGKISLCAIEVALGWTFAVDANQSKLPADRLVLRLSPGVQIAVGRHVIKGKDWSKLARVVHQGCEDKLRCRIEHGQIGATMLS